MLNDIYVLLVYVVLVVGKYVLVDKLFVLLVVEVDVLLQVGFVVECVIIVFYNCCYDVDFLILCQQVVEGCLGEIVECYLYFD